MLQQHIKYLISVLYHDVRISERIPCHWKDCGTGKYNLIIDMVESIIKSMTDAIGI